MEDIHPIKPLIETPILSPGLVTFLWIILFIIVLILLVLANYFYWKRKNSKSDLDNLEFELTRDYQKEARDKLLLTKTLLEQCQYKKFQLQACLIIKEYMSQVFTQNFSEQTTNEILNFDDFPSALREKLKKFFATSDPEKFAQVIQKEKNAQLVYDLALEIIEAK